MAYFAIYCVGNTGYMKGKSIYTTRHIQTQETGDTRYQIPVQGREKHVLVYSLDLTQFSSFHGQLPGLNFYEHTAVQT